MTDTVEKNLETKRGHSAFAKALWPPILLQRCLHLVIQFWVNASSESQYSFFCFEL